MKSRGFTLVELLAGMTVMATVLFGTLSLLVTGMKSFRKTSTDVDITNQNANALRRVSETLRQAMSVTISNSGKTISFVLPRMGSVDPVTGEKELLEPLTGDGVSRSYVVDFTSRTLKEFPSGRTLVKNISPVDPLPGSTQYKQAYTPFQLTTIGSYRAITINLITNENIISDERFMRMKTTAVVRNAK